MIRFSLFIACSTCLLLPWATPSLAAGYEKSFSSLLSHRQTSHTVVRVSSPHRLFHTDFSELQIKESPLEKHARERKLPLELYSNNIVSWRVTEMEWYVDHPRFSLNLIPGTSETPNTVLEWFHAYLALLQQNGYRAVTWKDAHLPSGAKYTLNAEYSHGVWQPFVLYVDVEAKATIEEMQYLDRYLQGRVHQMGEIHRGRLEDSSEVLKSHGLRVKYSNGFSYWITSRCTKDWFSESPGIVPIEPTGHYSLSFDLKKQADGKSDHILVTTYRFGSVQQNTSAVLPMDVGKSKAGLAQRD